MSAPDRLAELRRQRVLIQDHLAWLEREIASAETGHPAHAAPAAGTARTSASAVPTTAAISTREVTTAPAAASTTGWTGDDILARPVEADADAIMQQYRVPASDVTKDVRKGCLLYFAGAFAVLAGLIAVLYYALRH